MSKLRADGDRDYLKANASELQQAYEARVAEIGRRYANLEDADAVTGYIRRWRMRWEVARAEREVFGNDNLYLSEAPRQLPMSQRQTSESTLPTVQNG